MYVRFHKTLFFRKVVVMAIQLGFKMNLNRCIGCRACEMACQNENGREVTRRKVHPLAGIESSNKAFFSMACNHCESPACIGACPNHCFKKRRDGIVILDSSNCNSCKKCLGSCPFDAISINPRTAKIDKCNMCVDRLERGLKPACVSACVTKSLDIINIQEPLKSNEEKWISNIQFVNFTNPSVRFVKAKEVVCYMRRDGFNDK